MDRLSTGPVHAFQQAIQVHRFLHVTEHVEPARLGSRFEAAVSRQHDHLDLRTEFLDDLERLLSAQSRHHAIQKNHVDVEIGPDHLHRVIAVGRLNRFVPAELETRGQGGPELVLVVDEEDLRHRIS